MIDKPLQRLALPSVWGNPWHGLITGSTLALPGGLTATVPHSASGLNGDTWYIKKPGVTAPATLSAESAQGMEWKADAVFFGTHRWYSPQCASGGSLGSSARWIWCAPSGACWTLEASLGDPATTTLTTAGSMTLGLVVQTLGRSDLMPAATVSPTVLYSAAPTYTHPGDWTAHPNFSDTLRNYDPTGTWSRPSLLAHAPDGRSATLMLWMYPDVHASGADYLGCPWVCARAWSVTLTEPAPGAAPSVAVADLLTSGAFAQTWSETITGSAGQPTRSLTKSGDDLTWTYAAAGFSDPDLGVTAGNLVIARRYTATLHQGYSYDESGTRHEFSALRTWEEDYSEVQSFSGSATLTRATTSNPFAGAGSFSYSRTFSQRRWGRWRLLRDGSLWTEAGWQQQQDLSQSYTVSAATTWNPSGDTCTASPSTSASTTSSASNVATAAGGFDAWSVTDSTPGTYTLSSLAPGRFVGTGSGASAPNPADKKIAADLWLGPNGGGWAIKATNVVHRIRVPAANTSGGTAPGDLNTFRGPSGAELQDGFTGAARYASWNPRSPAVSTGSSATQWT